jgi:phosphoenolpyruvate carboxylase
MYCRWPFFRSLVDNAQLSLGTASLEVTEMYVELVADEKLRAQIFDRIRAEYNAATRWVLEIAEQRQLLDRSPVLQRSVALRNPYVDPLHAIQVALLRRWRAPQSETESSREASTPGDGEREQLLAAILHSMNGIAAGVQTFG